MKRHPTENASSDGLRRGQFDFLTVKRARIDADATNPSVNLTLPATSGTLLVGGGGGGSGVDTSSNQTIGGNKTFTGDSVFNGPGSTGLGTNTVYVNPIGSSFASPANAYFTALKDPSAAVTGTVGTASTLYVAGAPSVGSGGGSITNAYSIYVPSGTIRADGKIQTATINNGADITVPTTAGTFALLGDINSGGNLPSGCRVIYVAANGSDVTGTGSETKPYASPAFAMSAVTSPSVTNRWLIQLGPGDYSTGGTIFMKPFVFIAGCGILTRIMVGTQIDTTWDTAGGNSGFYNVQFVGNQTMTLAFTQNIAHAFSTCQCSNYDATLTVTTQFGTIDSCTLESCTMVRPVVMSGVAGNFKDLRLRSSFTCNTATAQNATNIFSAVNVETGGSMSLSSSGSNTNVIQLSCTTFRSTILTVVGNSGNTSLLYDYLPAISLQSFSGSPVLTKVSDIVTVDGTDTITGSKIFSTNPQIAAITSNGSTTQTLPTTTGTLALTSQTVDLTTNQSVAGNKTFTGVTAVSDGGGLASTPGLVFDGTTTGFFEGANIIGVSNNGVQSMLMSAGGILANDGTVSAPFYSFASDSNTGVLRKASDELGLTAGGTLAANFKSSVVDFPVGINIGAGTEIQRLEFGTLTYTGTIGPIAAVDQSVSFASSFSSAPVVFAIPYATGGGVSFSDYVVATVRNASTTGFTLRLANVKLVDTVAANSTYAWVAFN